MKYDPCTCWRTLISEEMEKMGDSWDNVESCTLSEAELDVEFYDGFGNEEGKPFTLWTTKRVYFPCCYDGAEWCSSISRNPDGVATAHVGG